MSDPLDLGGMTSIFLKGSALSTRSEKKVL